MRPLRKDEMEMKSKLAWMIQLQDQQLKREHSWELNKSNRCSKCFILKTKSGKCSMGCDD
ncbi:hypothetical protein D3C81_587430 [compost metagenome]